MGCILLFLSISRRALTWQLTSRKGQHTVQPLAQEKMSATMKEMKSVL